MPDPQPQLGYGDHSEADIDHVNIWMRSQPWYQQQLKAWGMSPNNVHLSDSQKQQIVRLAQAHGVIVDEGHDEVDASGNFRKQGHKLRNTLIVAGIAAATIATMGAAGVFAGAGAPGLAGTVGATGAAGAAGATGATAAGAFGPMAVGYAGATTAATIPSSLAAVGGGLGAAAGVGSRIAGAFGKGGSTAQRVADLFGAGASGVGKATSTAHDNRFEQELLELQAAEDNARNLFSNQDLNQRGGLETDRLNLEDKLGSERLNLEGILGANRENIEGQSAFETELMNRAKEEGTQRSGAMKDVYRASEAENPRVSPFDPVGAPKLSPDYLASLAATSKQGKDRLTQAPQYDTSKMPSLKPYTDITAPTYTNTTRTFAPAPPPTPIDVKALPGSTPGTGERVGNWLAPGLSVAERIAKWWAMRENQ